MDNTCLMYLQFIIILSTLIHPHSSEKHYTDVDETMFHYFMDLLNEGSAKGVRCNSKECDGDRITFLPGLSQKDQPSFKQYSGYLQALGTRQLHYW